jgi:hypothetical protein
MDLRSFVYKWGQNVLLIHWYSLPAYTVSYPIGYSMNLHRHESLKSHNEPVSCGFSDFHFGGTWFEYRFWQKYVTYCDCDFRTFHFELQADGKTPES